MGHAEVKYIFNRMMKDPENGDSGPYSSFIFTLIVDAPPTTWEVAYELLEMHREQFRDRCSAIGTLFEEPEERGDWIPEEALHSPRIIVLFDGDGGMRTEKELLPSSYTSEGGP